MGKTGRPGKTLGKRWPMKRATKPSLRQPRLRKVSTRAGCEDYVSVFRVGCCCLLLAQRLSNVLVYLRDGSAQTIYVLPH